MAIRYTIPSGVFTASIVALGCNEPIASTTITSVHGTCADAGEENCPTDGGDDSIVDDKNETNYVITAGERSAEAKRKPWSSWWYPHWQDTLFEGKMNELAPLQKYDAFALTLNRRTSAAAYERSSLYDPRAVSWSGLCDAWAIASVMEPEPARMLSHGQLLFRVGDLKALLLKTYENIDPLTIIGDRFNGEWDDEYADVAPNLFHEVVETELIGKKRAFIIDEDPGPEVWNEPAWKVMTRVSRVEGSPDIARVQTWLFLASPHVEDRDFVGTHEDSREYTYDLEGVWEGEKFRVKSGQWTERSQWDHPDYVIKLPDTIKRGSFNPHIDPELVDKIRKQ